MQDAVQKIYVVPLYKLPRHLIGLLRNPIKEICRMTERYGDIFALGNMNALSRLPNKPVIFINHPDYVKYVLKDNLDNYSRGQVFRDRKDLSMLEDFLGNGIFMSDGGDWEEQHRIIKVLFNNEAICKSHTIIQQELAGLVANWKQQLPTNNVVDIETSIHFTMLKILFKTYIVNSNAYNFTEIFNTFQSIMKFSSFNTSVINFIKTNIINAFGINYQSKKHEQYINKLNKLVDELITALINNQYEKGALTTILLNKYANKEISYKDVRDTIMNFLFAGFETTAAGITWTLYCMATNPAEQEKVYEELKAASLTPNINWNDTDLPNLKLAIKESMRLYPPVWFYMRQCLKEDFINGFVVRKNSLVMICPFALHKHKDYWDDPAHFNPMNFEKKNLQGKSFVYIPFGQGKRMCIGHAFAGVQMHMILAQLLHQFRFTATSNKQPAINAAIIIKGAKPVKLQLALR